MNKRILTMLSAVALPLLMLAQGWPAGYGGVMLQGFFWDSYKETPDCSPWGPWANHQTNDSTQRHRKGYTWATMYGAGWDAATEEWQVPVTTWPSLLRHKNEITPFIDLLWLPQSGATVCDSTKVYYKSMDDSDRAGKRDWRGGSKWEYDKYDKGEVITNPDCMGFVPVFYFHHGMTFNEDGTPWTYNWNGKTFTPMSYHGTEPELRQLISTLKSEGTYCIEDVVSNHRGGLGTWGGGEVNWPDFPSEYYKGELITWSRDDVTRTDVKAHDGSDPGTGNWDCGQDGSWAIDIDHHRPETRAKVIKYLDYLRNDLGYEGFRYDFGWGFESKHYAEYNSTIKPTFSVAECWGSDSEIRSWALKAYENGELQSAVFDFPLQGKIKEACNNGNWRALEGGGFIHEVKLKRYAVTFLDNHDTFKDLPTDGSNYAYQNRVNHNILEGNAFILAMPGTPCLFWPHYMHPQWHSPICDMIIARHAAGVTNESALWASTEVGDNGVQWKVTGEKGEVLIQLGEDAVNNGPREGFVEVWSSSKARYSIKTPDITTAEQWEAYKTNYTKPHQANGYAVIDKQTCSFTGTLEVNIKPSTDGCVVAYTTDGSVPTANSRLVTDADNGVTLNLTATTTVKAGIVVDGKVSINNVITRDYILDPTDIGTSVMVYIKAPWNPSVYAWDDNRSLTGSGYPGWTNISNTREVGGVTWYTAEIPSRNFNMIISHAQNADDHSSQSADINNVTSDVFYEISDDGSLNNVSNVYLTELRNPMVSIDKTSGEYYGDLTVTMTATYDGATIVYKVDSDDMATATDNPTTGGKATVTFNTNGSHTLRAAILHDGVVINRVARTYYIHKSGEGADTEEWASEAVNDTGINIYVHTSDDCATAPYLYVWDPNRYNIGESEITESYKPNGNFPGGVMTELKKVRQSTESDVDANWKTYYCYHIDTDYLAAGEVSFILSDGNGNQTADQTISAPGSYFFDYNVSNHTGITPVTVSPNNNAYVATTVDGYQAAAAPVTTGINVYVRRTDAGKPFVHWFGASLSGTPLDPAQAQVTPFVPDTKKKVDNKEWYYLHLDADAVTLQVTCDGKWGKTNGSGDAAKQSSNKLLSTGTYFLEYDGNTTLNDVSSTYLSSVTWEDTEIASGYNIYVKATGGAPFIYAWDSSTNKITTNAYNSQNSVYGDNMTIVRRVKVTGASGDGEEYYYMNFPASSNMAGFLVSYNGDSDKSDDYPISGPGSYFVTYSGSTGDLTDNTSTYVTTSTTYPVSYSSSTYSAPTSGYNFYIKANIVNNKFPRLHAWNTVGSTSTDLTSWPGTELTNVRKVKLNGSGTEEDFYYLNFPTDTNISGLKVVYTGDDDASATFTPSGEGNYFLTYQGKDAAMTNNSTNYSTTAASTEWTSSTPESSGISFYIKRGDNETSAPYLHLWDSDGTTAENFQLTEKRLVKANGSNTETEFWYYHMADATYTRYIVKHGSGWDSSDAQSNDLFIASSGPIFLTYNKNNAKASRVSSESGYTGTGSAVLSGSTICAREWSWTEADGGFEVTTNQIYVYTYNPENYGGWPGSALNSKFMDTDGTIWQYRNVSSISGQLMLNLGNTGNSNYEHNFGTGYNSSSVNFYYLWSNSGGGENKTSDYSSKIPTTRTVNFTQKSLSTVYNTVANYTEKAGTQSVVTTTTNNYTQKNRVVSASSFAEQTYVLTKVNNFVLKAYQLNDIYKVYVHIINGSEAEGGESLNTTAVPWIYTFSPELKGGWPGKRLNPSVDKRTAADSEWWYVELGSPTKPSLIISCDQDETTGGNKQTVDITDLQVGDNFYNYYIDQTDQTQTNKYRVLNVTQDYNQYFEIPSCATYIKGDKEFFYFENDGGYADPYAWVYKLTTVFSGSCWPGSELEVVGMSSRGNTVYRWVYDGDITDHPSNITFSDHGNTATQAPASGVDGYSYERGGYYTTSGCKGVVEDNSLTLADLIKEGTAEQTYVISNDLLCVGVSADLKHLYVKDADGNAIFKYYRTAAQRPYTITYKGKNWTEGYDYDQSNWAIVELPEALADNTELLAGYVGHTIQAGTLQGYLKAGDENRDNPAIKATVFMLDKSKTTDYELNAYYPANFMDQEDYFFMTPKPNELLRVTSAFYHNGAFYVPASRPGVNEGDLPGGVAISSDKSHYIGNIDLNNLEDGKQYEVTAIAKVNYNIFSGTSSGAPRLHRATSYKDDSAVSTDFELMLVDLAVPDNVVTGIDTVKPAAGREVKSVTYYNVTGVASPVPFDGVNIVVTRYTDGSMSSRKILK